jgi:hypothetical protein
VLLRGTESRVEVGPDGKVLAVQSDPALPAAVAQALEQNIRRIAVRAADERWRAGLRA